MHTAGIGVLEPTSGVMSALSEQFVAALSTFVDALAAAAAARVDLPPGWYGHWGTAGEDSAAGAVSSGERDTQNPA